MDMDDEDAFLYGEQEQTPPPAATAVKEVKEEAGSKDEDASNGLSASMAASLAAYGIDPSAAVAEEPLEDGGVEEDDDDDSDDDSDDDDIKLVMTGGPQRTLDLRKPQPPQQSNVIGIGKWAHTATANAPPVVSPSAPKTAPKRELHVDKEKLTPAAPTPDSLTDYTPAPRPGTQQVTSTPTPQPTTTTTETAPVQLAPGNGPPPTTPLPPSNLPVQVAPATDPRIDGTHPTGIIPSTGTSVYDVDVSQFEGSGQMWRRPGSDISDWFNYGFDEVTYPKYLRYRQEMEQGRMALANMTGMAPLTPEVANLLHLPTGGVNPQLQQMQMQQQMQQMQQQMMAMGGMDPAAMFAMQNQGMPGMPGMMGGMMQQGNDAQGDEEGSVAGENAAAGEASPQQMQMQNAFPAAAQNVPPARGGAVMGRGMALPLRGRGGAPLGPRGVPMPGIVPKGPKAGRFKDKDRVNDAAAAALASLDYGDTPASEPGSRDHSPSRYGSERDRYGGDREERDRYGDREERDRYGDREERDRYGDREDRDRYGERERERDRNRDRERESTRERERDRDRERERETRSSSRRDYDEGTNNSEGEYDDRERERARLRERERESDRYGEREERDRYGERETRRSSRRAAKESGGDTTPSATPATVGGLGPEGWESGEEDDRRRRKRSRSAEEEGPRRSTRAKRR